jgi:hypothetical protein
MQIISKKISTFVPAFLDMAEFGKNHPNEDKTVEIESIEQVIEKIKRHDFFY